MLALFGGFDFGNFLSQPIDQVILQLIWTFGWVPVVLVLVLGIMQTWVEIQSKWWRAHRPYILLAIDIPRLTEQSPKAVENIFGVAVALKSSPVWLEKYIMGKNQWRHSFEVTSINGYIQFYIWTEERYRDPFEAAIYAQYPDAEISLVEDYTKAVPQVYPSEEYDMWGSEYVLDKESFYPIRTWEDFEHSASRDEYLKDPLTNLFEGFALMRPGEQIWFQVVTDWAGVTTWKEDGDKFIQKTYGTGEDKKKTGFFGELAENLVAIPGAVAGDLFGIEKSDTDAKDRFDDMYKAFKVTEQERETAKAVVRKISKPGLRCKIRVVYIARKEIFSKVTRKDIVKGTLKQLAHEDWNKFGGHGSPNDDYWWQTWWYSYYQNTVMQGYVERSMTRGGKPFVLNTEELATIWHFPTINVKAPLIKKTLAKRAEPPTSTPFASEQEEMMTAPTLNMPPGEGGEEIEEQVDIFASPMSVPPTIPEMPESGKMENRKSEMGGRENGEAIAGIPFAEEKGSAQDDDDSRVEVGFEMPVVESPTGGEVGKVGKVGKVGSSEDREEDKTVSPSTDSGNNHEDSRQEDPSQSSGSQNEKQAPTLSQSSHIPDAIRVLLEPGVEPEDVGVDVEIHDKLEE